MNVAPEQLSEAAVTLRALGSACAEASGSLHTTLWTDFAALHVLGDVGSAIGGPALTLDTLTGNAYALADSLDQLAGTLALLDGPARGGRAV